MPQLARAQAPRVRVTLNLVAYSTPKPVMTKLIPAFKATPAGLRHHLHASYGGSSAQAAAVARARRPTCVILNTGNDMNLLVDNGLVNTNWNQQSYNGVVWHSVVVFGAPQRQPEAHQGLERPASSPASQV